MSVSFFNTGEIDMRAVTLFGVSAKGSDSPIGYFGTGLKYAIAVILRHGGEITIWSGMREYSFHVRPDKMRDTEFQAIVMTSEGQETVLPFTTHLGVNWDLWQAFRELYCNALDEGGKVRLDCAGVGPGYTCVLVDNLSAFTDLFYTRETIVMRDYKVLQRLSGVEVIDRPSQHLYYRGVRVEELQQPARYTYNVLADCTLTEDRTFKYPFEARGYLARGLLLCEDQEFLQTWLQGERGTFEQGVQITSAAQDGTNPSPAFVEACRYCRANMGKPHHQSVVSVLRKVEGYLADLSEHKLTRVQARVVERSLDLLSQMGYKSIGEYRMVFVASLGNGTYAQALREERAMVISAECFDMGSKFVAATILEEFLHLDHMFEDESRDLQNYLFQRLLTLGEELYLGEPL